MSTHRWNTIYRLYGAKQSRCTIISYHIIWYNTSLWYCTVMYTTVYHVDRTQCATPTEAVLICDTHHSTPTRFYYLLYRPPMLRLRERWYRRSRCFFSHVCELVLFCKQALLEKWYRDVQETVVRQLYYEYHCTGSNRGPNSAERVHSTCSACRIFYIDQICGFVCFWTDHKVLVLFLLRAAPV